MSEHTNSSDPPFGGKYDAVPNPPGLRKPTADDREDNAACRTPDLMHLLAKVAKVERSLTRTINGTEPTNAHRQSAVALRRLTDAAVRKCAADFEAALLMHPGRTVQ